ncbi:glycosyltransferase family 4 protein [Niallia nealsonii]|uniref:Group 1 glycosyl transferase n=1 Tax=Niallia nealsonii TaxID=115979 RepID=A0A2N0Z4B4_9BACI|nr:glycosyltransferase family 4 protein [Niallia nealsonii]PKG24343.1 group 1 glycosyl transferase [Niallia nealsonii]
MKILVIWRLLTVGGVNAGWRNRAIYFKKYGIETEFLYTTDHGGAHIMQDVSTIYLTKDINEIVAIIKKNRYDAIIVVDTKNAFKWIRKAKFMGPVIVEARTPELLKLTPHLGNFRGIHPEKIIVPSHYQKRLVSIISQNVPIQVIYNGLDTSFFRPLAEEEADMDSIPIQPPDKKIIGWIGRIDKRKNWQMLIEIAKKIKKDRKDVEIWLIGGAQSIQREEFIEKRETENLTDIIKWFPVIPYQQMPSVYAKIRMSKGCTLATTKCESFGNTFIESMGCGVPVVAADIMPMNELVIDGKTGVLFSDQMVEKAVKSIYKILDNDKKQQKMSINAIEHVQKNFSIEHVAGQYVELLKSLDITKQQKEDGGEMHD